MNRCDDGVPSGLISFSGRLAAKGIPAMLLLIFCGCATVPVPVTIKHDRSQSLSETAQTGEQRRTGPVDERTAAVIADLQHQKEQSDKRNAALLDLLKSKNMISDEEAALITGPTTTEAAPVEAPEEKKSLEDIKDEIRGEVTNELLRQIWTINQAMKEKDKRLRFGGDIRIRYEKDLFDKNNFNEGHKVSQGALTNDLENTWADQDRYRFRVRFGAEGQVNDKVDAVIRLSTGSTTNPVSTNATMGDFMNKDAVMFDLAYLKWQPWKAFTLYGGRMPNPWFSTDLVWDNDLNFEGVALNVRPPLAESLTSFLTVGAFPLQQSDPVNPSDFSQHSKWLYAGQVGLERKVRKGISAKVGAAYYYFRNFSGVLNDPSGTAGATDWSAPLFTQGGNTYFQIDQTNNSTKIGLVSKFKELNVTGNVDIGFWDPVHVVLLGDYVKNLGFDQDRVNTLVGDIDPVAEGFQASPKKVEGYLLGISVGHQAIQEAGQWKAYIYKKRLGADAVVDAFTDSDFHLGGTNARGWILGTDIGLAKNYWLTLKWLSSDEISGPPLSIDVLQVDVNARF